MDPAPLQQNSRCTKRIKRRTGRTRQVCTEGHKRNFINHRFVSPKAFPSSKITLSLWKYSLFSNETAIFIVWSFCPCS